MTKRLIGTMALAAALAAPAHLPAQDLQHERIEMQKEAVMSKLKTMRVDIAFENEPLASVIQFFQEYTGLNWLIDPEVDAEGVSITVKLKQVSILTALKLVLKDQDLGAMYREGMVVIVTKEQIHYAVVTELYDVRDLFLKLSSFPGPRLELLPGTRAGGGPGVSFTLEEPTEPKIDEGMLEDIIRSTTGGSTWDDNEMAQIQLAPNGLLIITQSREVQKEIKRLIEMLRWFR